LLSRTYFSMQVFDLFKNLFAFLNIIKISVAISCYKCDDATQLLSCLSFSRCLVTDDGCFTQTWVNNNNIRHYARGCYNSQRKNCTHFSDNCSPVRPVLKCCKTGDLCNNDDPLAEWKPLKPAKVTVKQVGENLEVRWKYGCDGRYQYVISYRKGDETVPPTFLSNSTNENNIKLGPLEVGNYTIAIRAYHLEKWSEVAIVSGQVVSSDNSSGTVGLSNISIIAIVVIVALLILLVILIVVWCILKTRKQTAEYDVSHIYTVPNSHEATQNSS